MFSLTSSAFGAFQRYRLAHDTAPTAIDFVPERGGCLLSLVFDGTDVLDGYQTPEELDFNNWGKSGVLYPFPNRLNGGQYTWGGHTYRFPLNDATFQNALHGFGMQRPLTITDTHLAADHATIRMEGAYLGELTYYPWPFTFLLAYTLYADGRFTLEMGARNDAHTVIPMGLGWHPYFRLSDKVSQCTLQLPPVDLVGIDDRMIPTGKRYDYDEFDAPHPIGATILDNCFALKADGGEVAAVLSGPRGSIRYWQAGGPGAFPYLQVFTPPYGTSIALEPMTCNVDAFNNKEGLCALPPGATLSVQAGVVFLGANA